MAKKEVKDYKLQDVEKELKNYKWVKQEDLNDNSIPKDVQHIAKIAFEQYKS